VTLRRVSVAVPHEHGEEARARMLAVSPDGFEEVEHADSLELAAYTDAHGERRLRAAFPAARASRVASNWEQRWREFHRGAVIGPIWVGPPWERPPSSVTPVVIDPGRAFGTGAHETTRLCLSFLLGLPRGSFLDVGCGSGVLAIAAAALGFAPVVAVDDDEAAVEAARTNARTNRVSIDIRRGDALRARLPGVETVVANVALPVIVALAPRLRTQRLVTSGYLGSDSPRLRGFRRLERRTDGDWAADLYERA
jgi:ribosomal protein L11 methyltransferase